MENQQNNKLTKKDETALMISKEILPIACKVVRDVLTCGRPQLSRLTKENSEEKVLAAIEALIVGVVENTNVGKSMNANQIKFGATLLLEKFWYLKLEDFSLCFRKGIMMDYGKLYDRLDIQVLVDWLKQYEAERNDEARKLQRDNGTENNRKVWDVISNDQLSELKQSMVEKMEAAKKEEPEPKRLDPTEFELQMIAEFDALPEFDGGMRIYKEQPIGLHEYAIIRAKEIIVK